MRTVLLNTGTELLAGDVHDTHLAFIAREIFALGLRIEERRTVGDGDPIGETLKELFPRAEIIFVTGGLGPTSDDITRDVTAALLGLKLQENAELLASLKERLRIRGVKWVSSIARQAQVPEGAQILPNENGSASGLYLKANLNSKIQSPHIFLLPGPPRELQPMFREHAMPILRSIVKGPPQVERRFYKIAVMGESVIEGKIGKKILAIPELELGYCARPGEVDVRIIGPRAALDQADEIVRAELGNVIFTADDRTLEEVLVELLTKKKQTLATAESCTGGLLANRITNIPGASAVLLAGYVCYANEAKIDLLEVDPKLIEQRGAVSEEVARAMAEGARRRAGSTYALSTTGIAGPAGGSKEKPVGTAYVALARGKETKVRKLFFPTDRETFKQLAAQVAFEMLRREVS
ncbi:MAG TPA: CinA family nicotinamide mononucleotide deamidase-related protein [Chthoniobacterales bacterium]|jgi:competence/damage-inducible protein CinA-like protein|nr:CinA family nicotinamide mononucleotide deamidase-related protein [Chthoniobacterales bacterium]